MGSHPLAAPRIDIPLLAKLRRRLREVGYDEETIGRSSSLGAPTDPWSLASGQATRDGSPLSTLVTLFWWGAPADARQAETALDPLQLADLEGLGLVSIRGGLVHPHCTIQPFRGLFVASDLPLPHADRVLGVVPASVTAAWLAVHRPARSALDMGTGSGVLALLLARSAERVVAVDVNPRAIQFVRFNAALNEAKNVEAREGSWFAPVAEERFDTIVANPPYVISPDAAYTYRDGGLPRDAVSRMVVGEAARHLEQGGFATVLCNWIHGDSWLDPLRPWVADTGCDALLLHYASVAPPEYAARLNGEIRGHDPRGFDATLGRWADYYREEGVERIGMGAVVLRRRTGASHWVRALDMSTGPTCPSGDHLLRLFEAADFLESCRDGEILTHAFRFVDGHRVEQVLEHPKGEYLVGPAVFRCLPGIGLEARIDARALEVLLDCDGDRALGELVAEAALRRGEPEDSLRGLVVAPARHLVERGFMVPMVKHLQGARAC